MCRCGPKKNRCFSYFPAVAFVKMHIVVAFVKMHIVVGKVDLLTCAKADKLEKAL